MKTYIQSAIVCIFFAFIAHSSFAQTKDIVVTGNVVDDSDNSPLPGVNITIAGTPNGMVTDAEGRFTFAKGLKAGDQLVFSFIGFVSQTYALSAELNQNVNIRMKSDNILIEEIASNEHYSVKARRGILAVLKRQH
jgi:hypothetical protein